MLVNFLMTVANRSPKARHRMFKWTFETLAALTAKVDSWTLMNYGYAELCHGTDAPNQDAPTPDAPDFDMPILDAPVLDASEEPERYCYQLYHHVAAAVDLSDQEVLEVSCGRGGGAAYVKRHLNAKSVIGLDLSANQVAFCRRVHTAPGLRFLQGAAEDLPLPGDCFDAVVNVEASCLYRDAAAFFAEVFRVLRPGGHFLYADIHRACDVTDLLADLDRSGLIMHARRDITRNVRRALELDHDRRMTGLQKHAPFVLRGLLKAFVGTQGSRIPNGLADGRLVYLSFLLKKPAPPADVPTDLPAGMLADLSTDLPAGMSCADRRRARRPSPAMAP